MQVRNRKQKPSGSRRAFLQSAGVLATGLSLAAPAQARAMKETLALEGGPKAVTYPNASRAWRWPLYDEAEQEAIAALLSGPPGYDQIALFEKEWQEYTGSPLVKAHCNGTSALTTMYVPAIIPIEGLSNWSARLVWIATMRALCAIPSVAEATFRAPLGLVWIATVRALCAIPSVAEAAFRAPFLSLSHQALFGLEPGQLRPAALCCESLAPCDALFHSLRRNVQQLKLMAQLPHLS